MKRIPPKIGVLLLEEDDIEKLNRQQRRKLVAVQLVTLAVALSVILIGVVL